MNVLILTEDFANNIERYVKEQYVDFDEMVIKTTDDYLKILFKKDGVVLQESKSFNFIMGDTLRLKNLTMKFKVKVIPGS